jgi:hypothetical protein
MKKLIRFYLAMRWHRRRNAAFRTVKPQSLEFWNERGFAIFIEDGESKQEQFDISCYQNFYLMGLSKKHRRV